MRFLLTLAAVMAACSSAPVATNSYTVTCEGPSGAACIVYSPKFGTDLLDCRDDSDCPTGSVCDAVQTCAVE